MKRNFLRLISVLAILVLFTTCKKTDHPSGQNPGLLILGSASDMNLMSLVPHPEGGFLIGGQTRRNGHQEIWVMKYNNRLQLEWERTLGGKLNNKFFKLFVDRDNNIMVSGLAYGIMYDSFPGAHKFWWPYLHLLNTEGNSIWESGFDNINSGAGKGSGVEERVSDIIQDENGNYLIGGEFYYGNTVHSVLFKTDMQGNHLGSFKYSNDSSGKIEALFLKENKFLVFNYLQKNEFSIPEASFFQIFTNRNGGSDISFYHQRDVWPWPSFLNGSLASLKLTLPNGHFTFNYLFENGVYRYTLEPDAKTLTGKAISPNLPPLNYGNTSFDNHFILAGINGNLYETDADFNILNQFNTRWKTHQACKLLNSDYIIIIEKENVFYLVHYTSNGKVVDHE